VLRQLLRPANLVVSLGWMSEPLRIRRISLDVFLAVCQHLIFRECSCGDKDDLHDSAFRVQAAALSGKARAAHPTAAGSTATQRRPSRLHIDDASVHQVEEFAVNFRTPVRQDSGLAGSSRMRS